MLHALLESRTRRNSASRLQVYVWQMPVMLLNISIALLMVGLLILIWDRAADTAAWNDDMKVRAVIAFSHRSAN